MNALRTLYHTTYNAVRDTFGGQRSSSRRRRHHHHGSNDDASALGESNNSSSSSDDEDDEQRQQPYGHVHDEVCETGYVEVHLLRHDVNAAYHYPSNAVRTAKYTALSALPCSLLFQFRKISNCYFLLVMIITLIPGSSSINPYSTIAPLTIVLGAGVLKDLWEDYKRREADRRTNRQRVRVLRDGALCSVASRDVYPGDVLLIRRGEEVKADCVVLNTALPDGLTYIETANLDGETNAKTRRAKMRTIECLGTVEDIVDCALHSRTRCACLVTRAPSCTTSAGATPTTVTAATPRAAAADVALAPVHNGSRIDVGLPPLSPATTAAAAAARDRNALAMPLFLPEVSMRSNGNATMTTTAQQQQQQQHCDCNSSTVGSVFVASCGAGSSSGGRGDGDMAARRAPVIAASLQLTREEAEALRWPSPATAASYACSVNAPSSQQRQMQLSLQQHQQLQLLHPHRRTVSMSLTGHVRHLTLDEQLESCGELAVPSQVLSLSRHYELAHAHASSSSSQQQHHHRGHLHRRYMTWHGSPAHERGGGGVGGDDAAPPPPSVADSDRVWPYISPVLQTPTATPVPVSHGVDSTTAAAVIAPAHGTATHMRSATTGQMDSDAVLHGAQRPTSAAAAAMTRRTTADCVTQRVDTGNNNNNDAAANDGTDTTAAAAAAEHVMDNKDDDGSSSGVVLLGSAPSPDLAQWFGQLRLPDGSTVALGIDQFLPRGCILRNTAWVLAAVMYTGGNTKMLLNLRKPKYKSSVMARRLNLINMLLFVVNQAILLLLCAGAVLYNAALLRPVAGARTRRAAWYIQHDLERRRGGRLFWWRYLSHFVLLSYLIPLSLYVTLEFNKAMQSYMMAADKRMAVYDEFTRKLKYARPRTSELNAQLGQVEYIFTDKTGTLTENLMTYIGGNVAGTRHDERTAPGGVGRALLSRCLRRQRALAAAAVTTRADMGGSGSGNVFASRWQHDASSRRHGYGVVDVTATRTRGGACRRLVLDAPAHATCHDEDKHKSNGNSDSDSGADNDANKSKARATAQDDDAAAAVVTRTTTMPPPPPREGGVVVVAVPPSSASFAALHNAQQQRDMSAMAQASSTSVGSGGPLLQLLDASTTAASEASERVLLHGDEQRQQQQQEQQQTHDEVSPLHGISEAALERDAAFVYLRSLALCHMVVCFSLTSKNDDTSDDEEDEDDSGCNRSSSSSSSSSSEDDVHATTAVAASTSSGARHNTRRRRRGRHGGTAATLSGRDGGGSSAAAAAAAAVVRPLARSLRVPSMTFSSPAVVVVPHAVAAAPHVAATAADAAAATYRATRVSAATAASADASRVRHAAAAPGSNGEGNNSSRKSSISNLVSATRDSAHDAADRQTTTLYSNVSRMYSAHHDDDDDATAAVMAQPHATGHGAVDRSALPLGSGECDDARHGPLHHYTRSHHTQHHPRNHHVGTQASTTSLAGAASTAAAAAAVVTPPPPPSAAMHGRSGSVGWYAHRYAANATQHRHYACLLSGECDSSLDRYIDRSRLYEGQSLDEIALVNAARENGVCLVRRSAKQMFVRVLGKPMCYDILAELEFTPQRKLMSILLRRNVADDGLIDDDDDDDNDRHGAPHKPSYHRGGNARTMLIASDEQQRDGEGDGSGFAAAAAATLPRASDASGGNDNDNSSSSLLQPLDRTARPPLVPPSPAQQQQQLVAVTNGDGSEVRATIAAAAAATSNNNDNNNDNNGGGDAPYLLLVKGADSSMLQIIDRSKPRNRDLCRVLTREVDEMASSGFRTLMLGQRYLSEAEVRQWLPILHEAQCSMHNRVDRLHAAYALLERDVDCIGTTSVEDKLQDEVPETLSFFLAASIVVWMLTGDKRETAVTIAHTTGLIAGDVPDAVCHLNIADVLHSSSSNSGGGAAVAAYAQQQQQGQPTTRTVTVVSGSSDDVASREPTSMQLDGPAPHLGDMDANNNNNGGGNGNTTTTSSAHKEALLALLDAQLAAAERCCDVHATRYGSTKTVVLVVDGNTLDVLFADDTRAHRFFVLGSRCRSAVCCRMTPLQKAQIVRMFQRNMRAVALAIGDGANDVTMLQESKIGVGIMGLEGSQAELASDYAIPKFRFLKRLLVVHGRFSLYRDAHAILYCIYKSVVLVVGLAAYSAYSGCSGQTFVDSWLLSLTSVVFSALQPFMLGILDKDVEDELAESLPQLYPPLAREHMYFAWWYIAKWLLDGLVEGAAFFFVVYYMVAANDSLYGVRTAGIEEYGAVFFTMLILVTDLRAGVTSTYYMVLFALALLLELAFLPCVSLVYAELTWFGGTNQFVYVAENLYASSRFWLMLFFAIGVFVVYTLSSNLYIQIFAPWRNADLATFAARSSCYREKHAYTKQAMSRRLAHLLAVQVERRRLAQQQQQQQQEQLGDDGDDDERDAATTAVAVADSSRRGRGQLRRRRGSSVP